MKPLAFRPDPSPILGESLLGLLARTANRNGFTGLKKVLSFADIGTPASLPSIGPAEAERVAFLLKIPVGEVLSRRHPRIGREDTDGDFIDFFGVPLRARYREPARRRVSPRALIISPHHRALHDLRPFSFCPETLEMLIDSCPVCRKPLGWGTTAGVAFCERCVNEDGDPRVDLRDFHQSLVEVDDVAALLLVADLVNPDPFVRNKALANVDPHLAPFGPGNLFELVITLARTVATPPSASPMKLRNLKKQNDFGFLTPDLMARTGRVLMDWRSGFYALADAMRASAAERPGYFGMTKELGDLPSLARQRSIPPKMRNLVKETIDADMERTAHNPAAPRRRALRHRPDLIDTEEASVRLGVKGGLVSRLAKQDGVAVIRTAGKRSPVLFRAAQIEEIGSVRRDMIDGTKAARLIALPLEALEALADIGMIRRAEGPALSIVSGRVQYRLSSLQNFVAAINHVRQPRMESVGYRRFNAVLRRLPAGEKPWVAIVQAVLDGTLPIFGIGESGNLFSQFSVDMEHIRSLIEKFNNVARKNESVEPLAYREAAVYIGMSEPNVSWLVAAGLIDTTGPHDRRITRDALIRFNEEFVHTVEIANRFDIHPSHVKRTLELRGIKPVCALRAGMRLIWRRAEVFGEENST